MKLTLISVPYDTVVRGSRMGAGPEHLLSAGLSDRFSDLGHSVDIRSVEHRTDLEKRS